MKPLNVELIFNYCSEMRSHLNLSKAVGARTCSVRGFQLQNLAVSFGWPKHNVGKKSERKQASERGQNADHSCPEAAFEEIAPR
jgi:hypothetical protein